MPRGQKHLISCRCVLPQLKRNPNAPPHHFTVFSVVNDDDVVRVKYAKCTNCGVVHRVIDICKSEIVLGKEEMPSIREIDDIRVSLPDKLVKILDINDVDLPTWEAVEYAFESKAWGSQIVLNSDLQAGERQGKYVTLIGENLFKVDTFIRKEVF
jgi:hypothetical protein